MNGGVKIGFFNVKRKALKALLKYENLRGNPLDTDIQVQLKQNK